ncbi:MAG TPA: hypothetical protein DIW26_00125 [Ruminococcus sp.]|nr:hypothetical protein [Ruminococcus sp.]
MKSEFITKPLSTLADIQTGPFGSQLHKEDYVQAGTPIVTVEHLGKKKFIEQNLPCVSDVDKERLSKYILREGDVVFSRVGSVDRCSYVSDEYDGWMFSGRCLRVRSLIEIDSQYLYYYFTLESTKQFVRGIATGATMPSINTKFMGEVPVTYPPIEEQHKIASVLSALDDKIELNNKINENLELQAQAIFKSWFVDFEPFGGVMPENWEKKSLSEISEMSVGGDKPKNATEMPTTENTVPIYSNGISNEGLYGFTDKAKIVEESVTVSARGTIGYVCLRQTPYVPIVRLITIIPRTNIVSAKYIYLHLKTMKISGTGTTQQQLTVPNFKSTELSIPNITVINKFTSIVNPMFEKIKDNKIENQRLASLRDTLLPKLMNGEIDVSEVKI